MRNGLASACGHVVFAGGLVVATLGAQAQTGDPGAQLEEQARVRAHTVRLRIERDWLAEPGRCLQIGASDLDVIFRGKPLDDPARVHLDRSAQPTIHALLIDGSSSMSGKLADARRAAHAYVETLDPEIDRGLVAAFDDSVILVQGVTSDREALTAAIDRIRLGRATALNDGLYDVIGELATLRERSVVLLLTDGFDTGSLYDRRDVFELAAEQRDLTIFSIGLGLPAPTASGPPGMGSARKFLQQLASRTGGRFFEAPTVSRLPSVYRRIREMLAGELLLTVIDDGSGSGPAKIRVRVRREGCKARVFEPESETFREAAPLETLGEGAVELTPGGGFRHAWARAQRRTVDEACRSVAGSHVTGQVRGFVADNGERLCGCVPDLVLGYGVLYDAFPPDWVRANDWLEFELRPFEIVVPALSALPAGPETALDRLAAALRAAPDDSNDRPLDEARRYDDLPQLVHGRTLFELAPAVAQVLYRRADYRTFARRRIEAEAQADLDALRASLRAAAPGGDEPALTAAIGQSDRGRRILARAAAPTEADVRRQLFAWLGDMPAHELFVRWEVARINRWLDAGAANDERDRFAQDWSAARGVFHLPSQARLLTLLEPVFDRKTERIGLWRVLLPRPEWLRTRTKGWKRHPEWRDLPLDLIPDLPLADWLLRGALERSPQLRRSILEEGYRVVRIEYSLRGKPRRHGPIGGFEQTRVTLQLERRGASTGTVELVADLELRYARRRGVEARPRLERLEAQGDDDPGLVQLLREGLHGLR